MATLIAGGLFATRALFKYNRKNFMFDKTLKQEREFQEQDMRIAQFVLYREDVRDLVELTVGKMDLYLISAALLIDRTTVMITKADEALPGFLPWDPTKRISPEWAVALNAMSLASGVFYLLLCLWLAMYASVSASSFGTRLLTQFVRLPIASQANVAKATATAGQYEDKGISEMLRVPIVQSGPPSTAQAATEPPMQLPTPTEETASGISLLGRLPTSDGYIGNPSANVLPAAMLDHIRLYRRVQLNWQAYDAYARVSLFCGANSLLYSCLYWSLGSFLGGQHAGVAAIAVALVFATIQVILTKLDLRLRAWHLRRIALLLGATPVTTTIGMLLYPDVMNRKQGPFSWQRLLMNFCAITAHLLHTGVAFLVLRASWPDDDEEALLPGKFRSTLYLDVFGWLLNPTGPGARPQREDDDEVRTGRSGLSLSQDSVPSSRPAVAEATRIKRSQSRWLGSSFRSSEASTRPSRRTSQSSVRAPQSQSFTEGATQRLLEVPGRPPRSMWQRLQRSFSSGSQENIGFTPELEEEVRRTFPSPTSSARRRPEGTQVERYGGTEAVALEDMQTFNDPAADTASTFMGQAPRNVSERKSVLPGQRPWSAFKRGTQIILLLWSASVVWAIAKAFLNIYGAYKQQVEEQSTAVCEGMASQWEAHGRLRVASGISEELPIVDRCGWGRAHAHSLQCHRGSCMAALLQPGGRRVRLCSASKSRRVLTLAPKSTWKLAPGAPSLKALVLHLRGTGNVTELYARTTEGALLLLRPGRRFLRPILEVDVSETWAQEKLQLHNDVLVSLRMQESSCTGLLVAWHLQSGAKLERRTKQCAELQNLTFCHTADRRVSSV